jgi:hypothetical protein
MAKRMVVEYRRVKKVTREGNLFLQVINEPEAHQANRELLQNYLLRENLTARVIKNM